MPIGAVMPIKASGSYGVDDLNRGHILFRSLEKFAPKGFFSEFYVVTPDNEVETIRAAYACWAHLNIKVISEDEVAPELSRYPKMRGWRKQQIVKLAIAKFVSSDFYITFDADVICLKSINTESLLPGNKAILQLEQAQQHPKWWRSSSRILNARAQTKKLEQGMTVTPAILATPIVEQLYRDIGKRDRNNNWIDWLCQLHQPSHPKNWLLHRYLMNKWTEYSLYYLTALKHDLFDKYHTYCGTEEHPQKLLVHDSHPFENWQAERSFSEQCPGLFCVVGSKTYLSPQTVWSKVSGFIDPERAELV